MQKWYLRWHDSVESSPWMGDDGKKLFLKFAEDAKAHQIGDRRIEKYRADLCSANTICKLPLLGMVKDIKALASTCAKINANTEYAPETKRNIKRTLGSLYNFIHNKERSLMYAPKEVKLLVAHKAKAADKRLARPVITREEIREISKYGDTLDEALLWLLFESGMRNGEFEQLKKSDIREVEEGLIVRVPAGKTGEREVIVVEATKYALDWLAKHPIKGKDAPLWYSVKTHAPLTQAAIAKHIELMVERMNEHRKRQGIPQFTKDINPHNFRHSRASELGGEPGMTEQILCKHFGWEIGSDMPGTYLHLTNEQVRRAVLRTYGKARPEEQKKIVTAWTCPRCKESNPIAMNYCGRCGSSQAGKVISETARLKEELAGFKARLERLEKERIGRVIKRTKG